MCLMITAPTHSGVLSPSVVTCQILFFDRRQCLTYECSEVHIGDDEHSTLWQCFVQLTFHSGKVVLESLKYNLLLLPI